MKRRSKRSKRIRKAWLEATRGINLGKASNSQCRHFESMSYCAYLKSEHWQRLRAAVLIRDKETCQMCYAEGVQMHVHHRVYRKRGSERFEDLMTVCVACHERAHATETEDRDFLFESQPTDVEGRVLVGC